MSADRLQAFLDGLRRSQLLGTTQLADVETTIAGGNVGAEILAGELVTRGWLTDFQTDCLLRAHPEELVLGPYQLLECLGEGGMGKVFKARHRVMDRVVALKVVRSDLLTRPDLVRRFHQEIKAAAQVSHPNIVIAHDAAEVDGKHFLVMEYVEGVGVDRLIARTGPLPVPQACDLVRQASLGLAHIAEKGLVHRDIKPSNLLVASKDSTLKILDMGLARLNSVVEGDARPDGLESILTDSGVRLGTADYLSPEQAVDARRADIPVDDLDDDDDDIPLDESPGVVEDWAEDDEEEEDDPDEAPRRWLPPAVELALLIVVPATLTGGVIWLVLRQLGYFAGR
ncbi:MAG TPA: serine/threonine-protein kinase [Isosphaeraceae bacterium]|jgi:serine/threonine protein kinase|nr:serine/threonine-protein kinase [Isosphaeraceae bacterium]